MSAKTKSTRKKPKDDNTVVRVVTLPVESPVTVGWGGLRESLRTGFSLMTDLANWAVHYLFRRDTPNAETPPAVMKGRKRERNKCYLYGAAVREFPNWETRCAGVTSNAQCVFNAVHKKYLQDRFSIQVRHESALLTYRYPQPWRVHNANWSVTFASGPWPGLAPVVVLPLPGLGNVVLRLKRGPEFARQLAMLRQLIDGTAKKGEAAVAKNRKGDVLVRLVGRFPRQERGDTPNVAFVHTDPNSLLVVEINGRPANVTNADHIRREIAKHRAFRQRAGEDKKREVRMDPRQRKNFDKYIGGRCDKQNNRLKTFVQQIAAQVARMCERQRVGLVCYDDTNKNYFRSGEDELPFPWSDLKTRLQQLLGCNPPGEPVTGVLGCGWIDGQFAHLTEDGGKEEWLRQARATMSAVRKVSAHKSRPPGKSHPAVSTTRAT